MARLIPGAIPAWPPCLAKRHSRVKRGPADLARPCCSLLDRALTLIRPWLSMKAILAFFDDYLSLMESRYPETARAVDLRARVTPFLISPTTVRLPRRYLEDARTLVRAFFSLRNTDKWKTRLEPLAPTFADPGNASALMSYDFHVDANDQLRLVEINTNASMSLLVDLLYEFKGLPNACVPDFRSEILQTFRNEFRLAFPDGSKNARGLSRAAIVDEAPSSQKLYVEFEMYRELFAGSGIETRIVDVSELTYTDGELRIDQRLDLIYNRYTDFYLESTASEALKAAVVDGAACVTPHPHEYRLLADKERLEELSAPGALESLALEPKEKAAIARGLILTRPVSEFRDHDALWAERKRWFFKPRRSYGGKAAYRGSSISRGVFTRIITSGDYLAQEFIPPATLETFKYDLRFFAYRDKIQLACARLYQGMMTNMHTPGGGLAAIEWL